MDIAVVETNNEAEVQDTTMHSFFCSPPDINLPLTPPTAAENHPASGLATLHDDDGHTENSGIPAHASEIQLLVSTPSQDAHRHLQDSRCTVLPIAVEEGPGCGVRTAENRAQLGPANLKRATLNSNTRYEDPSWLESSKRKVDSDPSAFRASQSTGDDGGGPLFDDNCDPAGRAAGSSSHEQTAHELDLGTPSSGSLTATYPEHNNGLAATGR